MSKKTRMKAGDTVVMVDGERFYDFEEVTKMHPDGFRQLIGIKLLNLRSSVEHVKVTTVAES